MKRGNQLVGQKDEIPRWDTANWPDLLCMDRSFLALRVKAPPQNIASGERLRDLRDYLA
jgi:hypothetical protein